MEPIAIAGSIAAEPITIEASITVGVFAVLASVYFAVGVFYKALPLAGSRSNFAQRKSTSVTSSAGTAKTAT